MLVKIFKYFSVYCLLMLVPAAAMTQTLVVADQVKRLEFNDQITLVSRTKTVRTSEIVASVPGQVVGINADEGVRVKFGAPIVTLEQSRLQLALKAKEAEANQAKARAVEAERAFDRSKDLYRRELIPESKIDTDSSLAIAAQERYRQLLAEQERIAFDLERCTIRAPFAGFTGRQLVDVGEWVNPGTPVFELVDPSVIKVTVDLPERYFGQVSVGSEVGIALSSDESKTMTGHITGISPNAVEATHTFPVFVTVNNKKGRLGGGMLVKASVSLNKKFTSLAVPKDAIVRQGLQTVVYTIAEGKAQLIPVVTSSTMGTMIAVEGEGLEAGTQIIVRGNERIFPGSPVQLREQATDGHSNSSSK